jgi:hypothetical protein
MYVIEQLLVKRKATVWLVSFLLPSLTPVFARCLFAMQVESEELKDYVDLTDLIYVGLTACVSNFSLIEKMRKRSDKKGRIVSTILLFFLLATSLGLSYHSDGSMSYQISVCLFVFLAASSNFTVVSNVSKRYY